ncbi:hypothetical protein GYA49_04380 [Candidatus Beckwithbacteria bacterium]|nr:hypothetical protein [Candidatus Beckwithbacteria bacterium]
MSSSKLQYILIVLSFIVIFQAIFITDYFIGQSHQNQPVAEQLPQEVIAQAKSEAQTFVVPSDTAPVAKMWLEPIGSNQLALFLDSKKPAQLVQAKLQFDPQNTTILDLEPEIEGIQLRFGQLQTYLLNQVDQESGQITLLAEIPASVSGQLLLATIQLASGSAQPTWVYLPSSQEGSYFLDWDNNIIDLTIDHD